MDALLRLLRCCGPCRCTWQQQQQAAGPSQRDMFVYHIMNSFMCCCALLLVSPQVFVANPNKPQAIVDILTNNREKLLKYLEDFHTDRGEHSVLQPTGGDACNKHTSHA
jgi:hypothetical protein